MLVKLREVSIYYYYYIIYIGLLLDLLNFACLSTCLYLFAFELPLPTNCEFNGPYSLLTHPKDYHYSFFFFFSCNHSMDYGAWILFCHFIPFQYQNSYFHPFITSIRIFSSFTFYMQLFFCMLKISNLHFNILQIVFLLKKGEFFLILLVSLITQKGEKIQIIKMSKIISLKN